MILSANGPFDYSRMYEFMALQDDCLYETKAGRVRRAEIFDGKPVLFELSEASESNALNLDILHNDGADEALVIDYVKDWFDLEYDINAFYAFASKDDRLKAVARELEGFRMLAYVDMTDVLVWAVLGQQINMKFAFELKRRLVQHFDHYIEYEGTKYWMMPGARELFDMELSVMRGMQISSSKSEYIKNCASGLLDGSLAKAYLERFDDYGRALSHLTRVKGIGPWSANVILMRTIKFRNAIPIGDAGLKNALWATDGLNDKPTREYINEVISQWGDFGTYATLYMWRVLG